MNKIEIKNINDFIFNGDGHYIFNDASITHNIYIKRSKTNSNRLFVFGQGAVDKTKTQPNFQRISWVDEIEGNVIIVDDPTVFNNELSIGWFQHSTDVNYFYRFSELLKTIALKMNFDIDKPILYGSSAGGFSSLMLSPYFNNPVVVVNNPQTDWTLFYEPKVNCVLKTIYNDMSVAEYREKYPLKYSAINLFKSVSKVPAIILMQNLDDVFHYERHCLPLLNWIQSQYKNTNLIKNPLITFFYRNASEGHGPCGKDITLRYLSLAKSL
ncbi:hypothetical protein ACFU5E_13320 [Aeromonas bestiarum]|uniref:hypothetical protein n=1 Tax=Aeromonas TaxID=642 RepID=UPI0012FDAC9C|nr:hypothetical protein [Aeromonas sp. CA23]